MIRYATITVLALALCACEPFGGEKDKEALKKECPAAPTALQSKPSQLGQFPSAQGISWTGASKKGPSTIGSGYMNLTIGPAHQAWSAALKGANGYSVTHEEQDVADSEVNFSGHGTSGQVKMKQTCKTRTLVTVTIRPS